MDWQILATGIGIGMAVAAPVGPVNLLVIRNALSLGFWKGLASGAGAVVGDGFFAAIAAFGLTAVSDLFEAHASSIELIGGLILFVLGVRTARSHFDDKELKAQNRAPARESPVALFGTTLALTVTNPAALMGFFAIFGSVRSLMADRTGTEQPLLLVMSVMIGSLLWWCMLSATIVRLSGRLSARVLDRLNLASGIVIAALGAAVLTSGIVGLVTGGRPY